MDRDRDGRSSPVVIGTGIGMIGDRDRDRGNDRVYG